MANSTKRSFKSDLLEASFLTELYKKTSALPFYAENGNQCVCINLSNCSSTFMQKLEKFIADNPDHFRLVARGVDYYLEILGRKTYTTAYQKSSRNEETVMRSN